LAGKAYDTKTQAHVYAEDHVFNDDPTNASMTNRNLNPQGKATVQNVVRFKEGRVSEFEFKQSKIGAARNVVRETAETAAAQVMENDDLIKTRSNSHFTKARLT